MIFGIILEFFLLFFLSRQLTIVLSQFLQLLHAHRRLIIIIIATFFLPGTLVHELSHWIFAKVMFVRTGKISLTPTLQGSTIRMGTAEVARVDPIRQLFIGLAPFLTGSMLIFIDVYFLLKNIYIFNFMVITIFIYLLFVISNSMFSSKKDLEGATFLISILLTFFLLIYIFDQKVITIVYNIINTIPLSYFTMITEYLSIPLILDIIIVVVLRLLIRILSS